LSLLKTKYRGFGPTLAHEKLVEKDKLKYLNCQSQMTILEPRVDFDQKSQTYTIWKMLE